MRFLKRAVIILLILAGLGFIFRAPLFRLLISYEPIGQSKNYTITNIKLTYYCNKNDIDKENPDIKDIIRQAHSLTSTQLKFTFSKADTDPNKLILSGKANCVGYAAFFSTVCNYLLEKYTLSANWEASPVRGKIRLFGISIHPFIKSPFFKDHDFVVIKNKKTKEVLAVDPAIKDYLYINFVKIRNSKTRTL